ncbi:hypothetical protein C8Q74DRAFT_1234186 [Fomes fomentarius]|nr:hypothetical protein C8Q74DRAFT_1234186 [Fomes fomentarius]
MSLSCLPVELLHQILVFALLDNDRPTAVLCVHRTFFELGQPLLHTHLRFRSVENLMSFARGTAALACAPRSLIISLAGGATGFEVFKHLKGALLRCRRSLRTNATTMADGASHESELVETVDHHTAPPTQLPLELLSLRLNSHSRNPHLNYIFEALSLASPKVFVWEGPDPEHHFSFAIVPTATHHLIRAIGTWTAVEHITLTNMTFPSDELGLNTPFSRDAPLLPPLPTLRTLYIGQATLLPPSAVAAMLARPPEGEDALERVRLVDTYRHSIWGPRIRLKDVEDAVEVLRQVVDQGRRAAVIERVRRVVRCEKKTERIMGGDDSDEDGVLGVRR